MLCANEGALTSDFSICLIIVCCIKDWGKAVRFCDQCLQLRPKCAKALARRGLARVYLGNYMKAQNDILEALDVVTNDDVVERERLKGILTKAKKGISDQNKALEKRKESFQKAFASKEGGIGDERVKEKYKNKKRKPVISKSYYSAWGSIVICALILMAITLLIAFIS